MATGAERILLLFWLTGPLDRRHNGVKAKWSRLCLVGGMNEPLRR